MTTATTAAPAAPAAPSLDAQLAAIRTVKLAQAEKIGAMCVAFTASGTALDLAALAGETGIIAGLDLAAETLKAGL